MQLIQNRITPWFSSSSSGMLEGKSTRVGCCVGVGVSGPIMLREPKDLFVVSFQNLGIGVYTFLEKLDVNKAVRD